MHEFMDGPDDVVALRVSEKLTSTDLSVMMDRLEQAMARHEVVHVFVEVRSLDGVELSGFGSHIARAMPLFGKLRNFGRVAVVADQAWVRAGTRIESALLPSISYRVFRPPQREEALDWVRHGGRRQP
jgi:hypothetical protein